MKIRGGVSYFLWDRDHEGLCSVQRCGMAPPLGRQSNATWAPSMFWIRRNEAVAHPGEGPAYRVSDQAEPSLKNRISSRKLPAFPTNFHGQDNPDQACRSSTTVRVPEDQLGRSVGDHNGEWVDDWKVLMTAVQGTSAAIETMFWSRPIVAAPGTACSETYLVAGRFSTAREAERPPTCALDSFASWSRCERPPSTQPGRSTPSCLDIRWTDMDRRDALRPVWHHRR